ncbi:MAG: hypothetical protein J6Y92_03030 [Lentisphaeria bacterium]|nr:hypothetical protein [Lentisphaeria bacterium]
MKLFSILTAAACLLVVSACASTPAPTDERVHVIENLNGATEVQPGNIYLSPGAAKIFTFRDVESEINENGYLAVRVFGKTAELSALKWAFCGDVDYEFSYRFYWCDADGNLTAKPEDYRLRSTIPGDPVRFVGHAPTEECRNFAMVLFLASEQPGGNVAEPADEETTEDAGEEESDAAEKEEEEVKEIIPSLPQENVSGDSQEVKVIGVSDKDADSVPKAVPVEKD